MSFKLRDYQTDIVKRGRAILHKNSMVYLAMEVRTGKTFCALFICEGAKNVLFITKKKAISSIRDDFNTSGLPYHLEIINYESLHKLPKSTWDAVIVDEAHSMGAFPLRSKRTKAVKEIIDRGLGTPTIFLSGTPTPESYSQIFHQLTVNFKNPFREYKSFYKWFKVYGIPKDRKIAYGRIIKDYSNTQWGMVKPLIEHLFIEFSQIEAGFETEINEEILYVDMKKSTYDVCAKLAKDLVLDERVIADTPVKLQSKLHQMYSGTIKFEDGTRKVFDLSKAEYIRDNFVGKKLAIFYKFVAEFDAIKEVFGDRVCSDIQEFDTTNKHICLQIVSGREGTKLSNADALIFYNIDFSATSYWQGRDRMSTIERAENKVFWIFARGGIEDKVHQAVSNKKNYTKSYFMKDFGIAERFKQLNLKL